MIAMVHDIEECHFMILHVHTGYNRLFNISENTAFLTVAINSSQKLTQNLSQIFCKIQNYKIPRKQHKRKPRWPWV